MMTLTASPRTTNGAAKEPLPRPVDDTVRDVKSAARPGFWITLLRALAAPAA
jgi:hypothetical protein